MIINPSVLQHDTKLCHIQCFNNTFKSPCLAQVCSASHYVPGQFPPRLIMLQGNRWTNWLSSSMQFQSSAKENKQRGCCMEGLSFFVCLGKDARLWLSEPQKYLRNMVCLRCDQRGSGGLLQYLLKASDAAPHHLCVCLQCKHMMDG